MDSQHGARNKFYVRNKSNQSGNKISMYSDAHIQIRNMGTQKEASAHNDKTEMDNVRMDPVVDLEHCMDNDIQSLLNTDSIPYLPINNRNLHGMMIQNRVDRELNNRFTRLEAECCHWRSLAQKLLLANRTVNNQSENFSGNQETLNENKKKEHRSSSSSSSTISSTSFQVLNSAITGIAEVMFVQTGATKLETQAEKSNTVATEMGKIEITITHININARVINQQISFHIIAIIV